MSRYSVGQKLPVLFLMRAPKDGDDVTLNLMFFGFTPLLDDVEPEIEIKALTVLSEHKVPWEFGDGDETPYDGFILEDAKGNTWHNQYPVAAYGQLSDTADAMFDLALESKEEVQQFLQDNPFGCGQGVLATRYLDDLDRTLVKLFDPKGGQELTDKYNQLRAHYASVVEALEAANLPVVREPLTMGGKVIEGMFRHRLVTTEAA